MRKLSGDGAPSRFSPVLIGGCLIPAVVIAAALLQPTATPALLNRIGDFSMGKFNHWILLSISFFFLYCVAVALIPAIGKRKLGVSSDLPEFSYFSWFSMIVGVGLGVGMLTWGVAEPLAGIQNNPDVVRGITDAVSNNNASSALKWSYSQWGLSAWALYSVIGLAIAYTGHRQKLPLTVSTSLVPLFGDIMRRKAGYLVDMCTIAVTLLCIMQILGYALEASVISFARTTGVFWLLQEDGSATIEGKLAASTLIVGLGAASAMSGLHRGVKWLSNINVLVSLTVLAILLIAGSFKGSLVSLIVSIFDYLIHLPEIMFSVWTKDGTEIGDGLQKWQNLAAVFHWSWWLAFSPLVGVFLARISKGRTVREYVFMTVVLPTFFCMIWMAIAGGNAFQLELQGVANGALFAAERGQEIFVLIQHLMANSWLGWLVSMMVVVLLISYLATSIDSAFIVIATVVNHDSKTSSNRGSIFVWALMLMATMALLVLTVGFYSVREVMVAAAVPISGMIIIACVSLSLAFYRDFNKQA